MDALCLVSGTSCPHAQVDKSTRKGSVFLIDIFTLTTSCEKLYKVLEKSIFPSFWNFACSCKFCGEISRVIIIIKYIRLTTRDQSSFYVSCRVCLHMPRCHLSSSSCIRFGYTTFAMCHDKPLTCTQLRSSQQCFCHWWLLEGRVAHNCVPKYSAASLLSLDFFLHPLDKDIFSRFLYRLLIVKYISGLNSTTQSKR